jgi:hypothetical protein
MDIYYGRLGGKQTMERSSVSKKKYSNERIGAKKQAYITPAFSNLDKS